VAGTAAGAATMMAGLSDAAVDGDRAALKERWSRPETGLGQGRLRRVCAVPRGWRPGGRRSELAEKGVRDSGGLRRRGCCRAAAAVSIPAVWRGGRAHGRSAGTARPPRSATAKEAGGALADTGDLPGSARSGHLHHLHRIPTQACHPLAGLVGIEDAYCWRGGGARGRGANRCEGE